MSKDGKKLVVLVCLVMFWIGLALVQRYWGHDARPAQVASRFGKHPRPRGELAAPDQRLAEIPRLKLDRIERVRPPFDAGVRNIFASIDHSSFPSSPPAEPQATPSRPLPRAPDPFVEEAKKVRFIGYAKADGEAMAFIAYGGEILVVPEKEVFGGQFQVEEVKNDAILVTSLDGTKKVLLGLSPGQSIAAPSRETQRGKRP